jgi:hypothetical protein
MRVTLVSSLFVAVEALGKAVTNAAGYDAMSSCEGHALLEMIQACIAKADNAVAALPPQAPATPPRRTASPERPVLDRLQVQAMDDTMCGTRAVTHHSHPSTR